MILAVCFALLAVLATTTAYDTTFAFNSAPSVETRSIDEIYQAALDEGGTVTLWHGGAMKNQEDALKEAFESRFPGMTLNVTVDLSSHHDVNIDRQLAVGNLYVDSAMLQTLQDYPRWRDEGVLLHYQPAGFDRLYPDFKDIDGAYYGYTINAWSIVWNTKKLNGAAPPLTFADFLKPEFKNKIVLCYLNEDDAVLHTFDLIMREYGLDWFEALLKQNPKWVRGAYRPAVLVSSPQSKYVATFTTTIGLVPQAPLNLSYHAHGAQFTSWPQYAAVFKDAPHPEGAKLLHNYVLSEEYQNMTGTWSTRDDVEAPGGYPSIMETPGTDPTKFAEWMGDRAKVERLRFWFEDKLGTPQGPSPV